MSISKSQALLLADGLLDDLGSDKEGLQPRDTLSELILLAGELVEDAQERLKKDNSNASGHLSESIAILDPVQSGNTVKLDIEMNFYGKFINKGVAGTKSGSGLYKFKYDKPSKKMVEAIKEGIKSAKKKTLNVNPKKTISKNEQKNVSISEIGSAYAAARSIVQKGIKATGFMDLAIDNTEKKVKDRLGAALKIDIINALDDN